MPLSCRCLGACRVKGEQRGKGGAHRADIVRDAKCQLVTVSLHESRVVADVPPHAPMQPVKQLIPGRWETPPIEIHVVAQRPLSEQQSCRAIQARGKPERVLFQKPFAEGGVHAIPAGLRNDGLNLLGQPIRPPEWNQHADRPVRRSVKRRDSDDLSGVSQHRHAHVLAPAECLPPGAAPVPAEEGRRDFHAVHQPLPVRMQCGELGGLRNDVQSDPRIHGDGPG